jgi:hypothetical protein
VPFATYLDFTDDSTVSSLSLITNGFGGTVDGVGFTLTSTDGAGISDDEIKYRTTEVSAQNVPLAGIQVL